MPVYFAEECWSVQKNDKKIKDFADKRIKNHCEAFIAEGIYREAFIALSVGLTGNYQQKNVATVLTAIDVLNQKDFHIPEEAVRSGFEKVVELTGLLGRWQVLQENPVVIADIGHNESGIAYVLEQLKALRYNRLHFIIGMVNDKDVEKILSMLPRDAVYYFTKASIPRAMNEQELRDKALKYNLYGSSYPSVKQAFDAAKSAAAEDDVIFVGGSNFVVAEVL